jgi:iron complex outermembrane receptor protein
MKRNPICFAIITLLFSSATCADHNVLLDEVAIRGTKTNEILPTYPSVTSSVDAKDIAEIINAVDTPDVLKYLPNIFVRKRDSADYTGAPIASRIWGASYSAKSIINVDGVPISNQLYNDNTNGTPKWYVTSPEEVRVAEVMYGPYSAAYSGNSMGAVVNIATKMPTEFTAAISTTASLQDYKKFGTSDNYLTGQVHTYLGDKSDNLSWRLSLTHQDAETQPRLFVTDTATTPYRYCDKTNSCTKYYQGAGSLIHGVSDAINLKMDFRLSPDINLIISPGVWYGTQNARAESYRSTGSFSSFNSATAANIFNLDQVHYMNSAALKSNVNKDFNWELIASNYYYGKNFQQWGTLNSSGVNTDNKWSQDYSGTQWTNLDWRSNYRYDPNNLLSFGLHYDFNKLNYTQLESGANYAVSKGITETYAVWGQNAWKYSEIVKVTVGLRAEQWKTHDGYIYASGNSQSGNQSSSEYSALSPKLSVAWDAGLNWLVTTSYGRATRFPTTQELYSTASANTTFGYCSNISNTCSKIVPPSTSIKPERVDSLELSFENLTSMGDRRVTLFVQDVQDALLSTLGALNPALPSNAYYSSWTNIKKVRNYGVEFYATQKNVGIHGLDLNGGITYVKSEVVDAAASNINTLGKSIIGNPVPYTPPWRVNLMANYRPNAQLTYSVAGRYQKAGASSLDNNDPNPNTYGGFSSYFVVDTKVSYKFDKNWRASFGIDNVLNRDYFIFHPFPQRTFVANLKYTN